MGRTGSTPLDTNDMFPELDLQLLSGESLKISKETRGTYSVVLLYRGHW